MTPAPVGAALAGRDSRLLAQTENLAEPRSITIDTHNAARKESQQKILGTAWHGRPIGAVRPMAPTEREALNAASGRGTAQLAAAFRRRDDSRLESSAQSMLFEHLQARGRCASGRGHLRAQRGRVAALAQHRG